VSCYIGLLSEVDEFRNIAEYWRHVANGEIAEGKRSRAKFNLKKAATFFLKAADRLPDDEPHRIGELDVDQSIPSTVNKISV
jgi:hypothetical protein